MSRCWMRLPSFRTVIMFALASSSLTLSATTHAGATHIHGRISNVTFAGDYVMIMIDAGLPDNCVGTPWGWMKIPAANKAMTAFVTGLWLRGDAASTPVTVYADGLVDGYCRVSQIDPQG